MKSEEDIAEMIVKKKPRLKPSSIKSYIAKIKCINRGLGALDGSDDVGIIDALYDKEIIDEYLKDYKLNTRKTYYGAIITVLDCCGEDCVEVLKEYRKEMEDFQGDVRKAEELQIKTARQDANWVPLDKLKDVVAQYKTQFDFLDLSPDESLSKKNFVLLQKYIVGMLYIGDVDNHPPLRLDYAPMVIKHISKWDKATEKENSLVIVNKDKKFFSLVDYKTSGTYGFKSINLSDKMNDIINLWLKFNKSTSLLLNQRLKPMNGNDLSKFINKVFSPTGKKVGATLLRHIVISELFPAHFSQSKRTADLMLHSPQLQTLYSKKI